MKFLTHMFEQPFITATGAAALVHSTWSLGTLFAGEQPDGWHLLGWLIPALLIAFALDVGQVATSAQIREHGMTISRAVTFVVFAVATYYLQFLYIAHHMPALELSAGISDVHRGTALALRDLAIWLIPALLPLSTLLYTMSGERGQSQHSEDVQVVTVQGDASSEWIPMSMEDEHVGLPDAPLFEQLPEPTPDDNLMAMEVAHDPTVAHCESCGWTRDGYKTAVNAGRALRVHQSQHCPILAKVDME